MTKNLIATVCVVSIAGAVSSTAQQGFVPPRTGVRSVEPWRPAQVSGVTRIIGSVIDIRQVPVAYVQVQLRNLIKGIVEQEATTDGNGEYDFQVDDPSTYVVEMSLADGYVLGLSNAGTVARYETLQTVVQLPGRWDMAAHRMVIAQSAGAFFGISGANSMTNTTLEMAIDQNITPADNGEPVSPNK